MTRMAILSQPTPPGPTIAGGPEPRPVERTRPLEAYIPKDRRRALSLGAALPDRMQGSGLFVDISGFTKMTETLANELGARRGAEELTRHLNRVFHALIEELDRHGGDVIYFSGDALTCWIDDDDGLRATACALAMQRALAALGEVATPQGTIIPLAMKAAVASGSARRFVVGDPDIQLIDVLAGGTVEALAAGEQLAGPGEVLLDVSALDALADRVLIRERRRDGRGRAFGVATALACEVETARPSASHDELAPEVLRRWLIPGVYERLATGESEFVAELRSAYPLFVSFAGIDYDDEGAAARLDDFVRRTQRILVTYGGSLLHLTIGDKGAYLSAVFGPPFAHEDDAVRAAAAALALRDLASETAIHDVRIGLTYGRLRSGPCGHASRQTFTCFGEAVNVAARLMSHARAGQILVSRPLREAAGASFVWEALSPIQVKGKVEPVPAFALVAPALPEGSRARSATALPMVGRAVERAALIEALDHAVSGDGSCVGVVAEAGMGKSRLVADIAHIAEQRNVVVVRGECQSYGTRASYFVWRSVWSALFGFDGVRSAGEATTAIEARLAAVDPSLVPRAPLLGVVLDIAIAENELTRGFDAKLRKTSLEDLLVRYLQGRAREEPLLIVLEDCHWMDALSRDLLIAIARGVPAQRVLIVLAYRPASSSSDDLQGVERLPSFRRIGLSELARHDTASLIRAKLAQVTGVDAEPPRMLVAVIAERAQGNPFYIEELVNYVRSQGLSLHDEVALNRIELPESLQTVVLSRIDTLDESARRTLKVASILGRTFSAPMLPRVYPDLGTYDRVEASLALLDANDLVKPELETAETWSFRHGVTQEVAYESMPFGIRAMLHGRAGAYLEIADAGEIDRHLDLLAYHYGRSEDQPKKREYLRRAGDAAEAAYANAAAIDYYERLAPLLGDADRADVLLRLAKVLELVGDWRRAEQVAGEALEICDRCSDDRGRAACETALAEIARKQGRYDEAFERLARAEAGFRRIDDEAGVGRALHLVGTVAAQRGDYAKAVENYEASLAIRERQDDKASMAALFSNLGIVGEYRGDYSAAREFHEKALTLRQAIGDRRNIAVSMNNLGMIAALEKRFDEARERFSEVIRLFTEVGDTWAVAITHNNLGNALRGLGDHDAARRHYASSLRACRDYDDRWALAFLLEDIGLLGLSRGDPQAALVFVGAADACRALIGAPRPPSLQSEIDRQLEAVVGAMSPAERDACRARGRALDPPSAIARALDYCESTERASSEP